MVLGFLPVKISVSIVVGYYVVYGWHGCLYSVVLLPREGSFWSLLCTVYGRVLVQIVVLSVMVSVVHTGNI